MKVSIVGTGNVAHHLAQAFADSEVTVHQIYGRDEIEAEQIAAICNSTYVTDVNLLDIVDVLLIAISDDSIRAFVKTLPQKIKEECIVAHTSGTKPIGALKGCEHKAIFYPLQTFTQGLDVDFSNIPICLNGKSKTVKKLNLLAQMISGNIRYLSDEERKQAHLSAVIINNFTNHLIYLAKDRLDRLELDPTILDPLLQETIRKQKLLTPYEAQTGPARREDVKTISKHLDMLEGDDQLKELYQVISDSIIKIYS